MQLLSFNYPFGGCIDSKASLCDIVLELGRKSLLGANGADDISRKLASLNQNYDPAKDNRMDVVTCGCVLNLATDDGEYNSNHPTN